MVCLVIQAQKKYTENFSANFQFQFSASQFEARNDFICVRYEMWNKKNWETLYERFKLYGSTFFALVAHPIDNLQLYRFFAHFGSAHTDWPKHQRLFWKEPRKKRNIFSIAHKI